MPPVAKTPMPAASAAIIVAATVVAPHSPDAIAKPRFGRETLRTEPLGAVASASSSSAVSPTRSRPPLRATVAGTAPEARTAASDAVATSTFCGYGRPWLMSVDSRATTGMPSRSASATSGAMDRRSDGIMAVRVRRAGRPMRSGRGRIRLAPWPSNPAARCQIPTPELLHRQVVVEEHDLAPDGSFAILSRRVVEGEQYVSHLWLVPLAVPGTRGGKPRRLTTGSVRDMWPRISPDGLRVAYTRAIPGKDKEPTALRILDLAGGEPHAPALGELSCGEPAWSPDGRRIAFIAQADPQRFIVGKAHKDDEPMARRMTVLDYRYDYEGHLDRRPQLHVVQAADGAKPRRLTDVSSGVSDIAWRPDGRTIAFTADPRDDADLHPRTSIFEVPAAATRGKGTRRPGRSSRSRDPCGLPPGRRTAAGWPRWAWTTPSTSTTCRPRSWSGLPTGRPRP